MDNKIKFISGLYPKPAKVDWVKSDVSVNIELLIEELNKLKPKAIKGFINLSLCESKAGKQYFKLNDYKPKEVTASEHSPDRDDLPF
tara:strand:+ start:315 stop:575 length:261 start_codon:yes stop_codon:yes gene_type:complete